MSVHDEIYLGDEILRTLYHIDPSSVIAGGAPRDWYFDKECSDIDAYFYYRPDLDTGIIQKIVGDLFGVNLFEVGSSEMKQNHEHRYLRDKNISNVWEFPFHGKMVQLIRRNIPTFGIANTFALNLSMIWYKNRRINPDEPFLDGVRMKSIVKMNELYADGDKYVQKIRNKFPSYKYFSSELEFYKYHSRSVIK